MIRSERLRLAKLALAATIAAAAGCDDARQADRRVAKTIEESRLARVSGGEEGLAKAQELLKQAASEADAAAASKAHAKAMLAQAEFDNALARISNPASGISAGHRDIAALVFEMGRLAQQIRASNNLIQSYRAYRPTPVLEAIKQRIAEATGSPEKATWIGEGGSAIPTLAAVQQEIARIQDEISKRQQQIATLQSEQQQVAQEAEQLSRQAETLSAREGLEQFRKAADLRKRSADLANQIEVAQAQLAPIQQDLALAQARQQAVTTAIEQFQRLAKQIEQGWSGIEQQMLKQQQATTAVVQGGGDNKSQSVAAMSSRLAEQNNRTQEAYATASDNLTSSISNYSEAAQAASDLARDIGPRMMELPRENKMAQALQTLVAVYNPAVFKLGQANAQLALANLQAARAQAVSERLNLVNQLTPALKEAMLTPPKGLGDASLGKDLKQLAGEAAKNFTEAVELFQDVSAAATVDESTKQAAHAGRIYSLYGRSLLARATGDKQGAQLLATARKELEQLRRDNPNALVILPSELVAAPTTAPTTGATTPAGAAPRTPAKPAPAGDASGAATPTPGSTAAPADTAAPPDDAAPAEPTTPEQ